MSNIFEKASRAKLRFEAKVGLVTIEDLWDLPLTSKNKSNLNDIAKTISQEIKQTGEEDFVGQATTNPEATMKLEIVKHVISVRLEENKAKTSAQANKAQNERILDIISRKRDKVLEDMSLEELEAIVNKCRVEQC